jgi:hypothetical protein
MKAIQYSEILKQSLIMTWKNKFMWFFGLLIFFGSLNFSLKIDTKMLSTLSEEFQAAARFIQNNPGNSFMTILLLVAGTLILFFLRVIGISGIIKSANNIVIYKQSTIKAIISETKKYLSRLVLLEIIINAAIFIILIIFLTPIAYLFTLKANVLAITSFVIAVLIFVPLAIVAYYLRRYAYFFIVLSDTKIKMALEMAYELLRKNIKASLIMACLSIVMGVAFFLAVLIFIILIFIVAVAFGLITYLMLSKTGAAIILAAVTILGSLVVLILFSWYFAFVQTVWVLFFQQISLDKQKEKAVIEKTESAENVPTPEAI